MLARLAPAADRPALEVLRENIRTAAAKASPQL